jgi:hypothetical protein
LIARKFDLILTSHYTPENLDDAKIKLEYLKTLKTSAASSPNAAAFKQSIQQKYPAYTGAGYLDMTSDFFFKPQAN